MKIILNCPLISISKSKMFAINIDGKNNNAGKNKNEGKQYASCTRGRAEYCCLGTKQCTQ